MGKRHLLVYHLLPSRFGEVGIVRQAESSCLRRILLPRAGDTMRKLIRMAFPDAVQAPAPREGICMQIAASLEGDAVSLPLDGCDLAGIGGFARRVLIADHAIPRGRVMTYGGLSEKVGVPGGARAVGNVMAENPFPLVIPCHRVIRSGGGLGGFGGGLPMKWALLASEGVGFDAADRVLPEFILG